MSIPIRAQPLQYPRAQNAPSTFQALLEAIAQYTLYLFDPDYVLAVKGSSTPQTQDNNKLWIRTDANGRPLGLFVMYNGIWRQVATGNPFEVTMFAGDWTLYFDTSGLSTPGQPWDGWAVANGNNGTFDLTNQFVVPGYAYTNGQWVTNVSGTAVATGGANQFQIQLTNLPALSITVGVANNFASGNDIGAVYPGLGTQQWNYTVIGTGGDLAISALPPFIALGFLQFIGYGN